MDQLVNAVRTDNGYSYHFVWIAWADSYDSVDCYMKITWTRLYMFLQDIICFLSFLM